MQAYPGATSHQHQCLKFTCL